MAQLTYAGTHAREEELTVCRKNPELSYSILSETER